MQSAVYLDIYQRKSLRVYDVICIFFQDLDVLLGEHDLTTAFDYTFRMSVSRIIEHPLYNPIIVNNDYSILVLREEVR